MEVPLVNRADAAWLEAAPRARGAPAVCLESVGRRYGRGQSAVSGLDGVSLEVGDGAFVAVMGPSGSGKSTLLNLIGALDRPTDGRIIVGERDIATLSTKEAARYRESSEEAERTSLAYQKERESLSDLQETVSQLSLKNAALETTLAQYRLSSDQWREDIQEEQSRNIELQHTIHLLKRHLELLLEAVPPVEHGHTRV